MHDALLIAKREYLERIRSKAFLFTTLALPIFMGLIMGGSVMASMKGAKGRRHIVIASNQVQLADSVKAELENSRYLVDTVAPASEADRDRLTRDVDDKKYDGVLWLQVAPGDLRPQATYESRSAADLFTGDTLRNAITQATTRKRLAEQGISAAEIKQLMQPVELHTRQVKNGKASSSNTVSAFVGAYIMIFLLYFSVIYYGMNVARSVIEEKTSRVFEVLLATTKPESLMTGKLLGVGAAGLTQIAIWLGLGLLYGGSPLAAAMGKGGFASLGISITEIVFFVLFFLLGFLFYSALSAAFGASVSSEQEIQQFSFIIVLPMLVGLVLMTYILSNPNAPAVVALSLFPPCTPMVMYLRMASQMPPVWQLVLSVLLMIAAIWCMLWIAARVYRVGILMYGKRATLPEIVRWLRYT
jgi:ABC-2 type transport system permease protein